MLIAVQITAKLPGYVVVIRAVEAVESGLGCRIIFQHRSILSSGEGLTTSAHVLVPLVNQVACDTDCWSKTFPSLHHVQVVSPVE